MQLFFCKIAQVFKAEAFQAEILFLEIMLDKWLSFYISEDPQA